MRRMCSAAGIAIAIALIAPQAARAATCEYAGAAGGAWENALNWKNCGGLVPTSSDAVVLDSGDDVQISTADAVAGTLALANSARLGFANTHSLAVSGSTDLQSGTVTGAGKLTAQGG